MPFKDPRRLPRNALGVVPLAANVTGKLGLRHVGSSGIPHNRHPADVNAMEWWRSTCSYCIQFLLECEQWRPNQLPQPSGGSSLLKRALESKLGELLEALSERDELRIEYLADPLDRVTSSGTVSLPSAG